MNAPITIRTDHRESSDNYRGEIIRDDRWRIVIGSCNWQWVLQRRKDAEGGPGARWLGCHFCRTRSALTRLWTTFTGQPAGVLDSLLPEHFPKGGYDGKA